MGRPPPCWEKFQNNLVFYFEGVPKHLSIQLPLRLILNDRDDDGEGHRTPVLGQEHVLGNQRVFGPKKKKKFYNFISRNFHNTIYA